MTRAKYCITDADLTGDHIRHSRLRIDAETQDEHTKRLMGFGTGPGNCWIIALVGYPDFSLEICLCQQVGRLTHSWLRTMRRGINIWLVLPFSFVFFCIGRFEPL